ncbi:MAG: MBL fold metallo-hydrolase [Saprospiraceae bacterium]
MENLRVEQIYTNCLYQGTYYIVSNGEAIIIDPLRDPQPYLDKLKKDNVKLKYIFETHYHADFVSGHFDLSELTKAAIIFGPNANFEHECIHAIDGQFFEFGNCKIKAIHTPGHTMESTVYLLLDENKKEHSVFTGDTLFIGDVGRPDLAQQVDAITQEDMAGMLFDSLRNKLMTLPPHIMVYPAHGAGSACGKNMSRETFSTLDHQLKTNYALRSNMSREEFIIEVLDGLTSPPAYFKDNVLLNKSGYSPFQQILKHSKKAIDTDTLEQFLKDPSILILDTRPADQFSLKYIPGSLNIGLNGDFAPWVGSIIGKTNQKLILVSEIGREEECLLRLSRVGFDAVIGYLEGGFESWLIANKKTEHVHRITSIQFEQMSDRKEYQIIDIRKENEFRTSHIKNAKNLPLANIQDWSDSLNEKDNYIIHCAVGYRSMIAASILKAKGIHNFLEIEGGFNSIRKTSIETVNELSIAS